MDRNWREYWTYTRKSMKHALIAVALVPVFYLLMNPEVSSPGFMEGFWISLRIGTQITAICWLGPLVLYTILYAKNPQIFRSLKTSVPFQIALGLVFMILGVSLSAYIEPMITGESFGLRSWTISSMIGTSTFLVVVLLVAYRRTQAHNLQLRAKSAEASLSVLRNQMQPHFLFNSLNSLAELIELDKAQAATMTQSLSDLYREILLSSQSTLSSATREISIVQKYLELEKIRFNERLRFKIQVPNGSESILMPSLMVQTLVENAVKHGVSPSLEGGEIEVQIVPNQTGYHVVVANTGAYDPNRLSTSGAGTGIANTKARLDLLYGDRHQFKVVRVGQWTQVDFWISGGDDVTQASSDR